MKHPIVVASVYFYFKQGVKSTLYFLSLFCFLPCECHNIIGFKNMSSMGEMSVQVEAIPKDFIK